MCWRSHRTDITWGISCLQLSFVHIEEVDNGKVLALMLRIIIMKSKSVCAVQRTVPRRLIRAGGGRLRSKKRPFPVRETASLKRVAPQYGERLPGIALGSVVRLITLLTSLEFNVRSRTRKFELLYPNIDHRQPYQTKKVIRGISPSFLICPVYGSSASCAIGGAF